MTKSKYATIGDYCAANPMPTRHQKAGEKTALKRNPMSAGWAWKPDRHTELALKRGARKIRKAKQAALDSTTTEEAKMATKKAKAKKTSTRKTSAKKVAKKVAKKTTTANRIPLKKICQELKLEPKLARRKLRAANLQGHDAKARWDFTPAQAKKAKEVLSA